MSDYDRNTVRWGQGAAQSRSATVDQGLRAFMLGVYNNMMIGLVLTGIAAMATNYFAVAHDPSQAVATMRGIPMTAFGEAIYFSPLKYVVMLAPLAFVFFISFKINTMAASTARTTFFLFSAVMGLSISSILLVYTGASIYRAFFITAAAFGGLSLYGYTTKARFGADARVSRHGSHRADGRVPRGTCSSSRRASSSRCPASPC